MATFKQCMNLCDKQKGVIWCRHCLNLYKGLLLSKKQSYVRFKEEERSVLVSVTLMKGITGFKELRKNPE